MTTTHLPEPLSRLPTGISGLDHILHGGLFRGGSYLLLGLPGTGKTVLVNQICFQHVRAGGRALYITLLAEDHGRMLAHLQSLTFFSPEPLGRDLQYLSGSRELREGRLDSLVQLIQHQIQAHRPDLLVLDGLEAVALAADSIATFQGLVRRVQTFAATYGCTVLMVSQADDRATHERMLVDGVLVLSMQPVGVRTIRELEVTKHRGSDYVMGRHHFAISAAGYVVYPRLTTLVSPHEEPAQGQQSARLSSGIPGLDALMGGGLPAGSSTLMLGPAGVGKTVFGLHLLHAGAARGERSLYMGFFEPPHRLIRKGDNLGLPLGEALGDGTISLLYRAPTEHLLDALGQQILDEVHDGAVRRVVIDGLIGFRTAAVYPEQLVSFLAALLHELECRGVTTLVTDELPDLLSPSIRPSVDGSAALFANIVLLRYVELQGQLRRLISVLKVSDSAYDQALYEFTITGVGIALAGTFADADVVLSGTAQPGSAPAARTQPGGAAGEDTALTP